MIPHSSELVEMSSTPHLYQTAPLLFKHLQATSSPYCNLVAHPVCMSLLCGKA